MAKPIIPQVHRFNANSSSNVYDYSQTCKGIAMGDILVVTKEKVVGFLFDAWPMAVTTSTGSFHGRDPQWPWRRLCLDAEEKSGRDYRPSVVKAIREARRLGFPVAR